MESGLVSVITPTYNSAKYLGEAIASVQRQSYRHWEMIIVDDCSTDCTKEVVGRYMQTDSRIRYCRLERNAGAAAARTAAMELADGEYMAFLDSDDLWAADKLKLQIGFMKRHHVPFTCTSYEHMDEGGQPLNRVIRAVPRTGYNRLLLDCPVGNSTVMYHVKKMGKFQVPDIRKRNDDALWLQMLKKEKYIYGIQKVLARYRVRRHSLSNNKWTVVKYHWILYRKIEKLGVIRSIFHILFWCVIKIWRLK